MSELDKDYTADSAEKGETVEAFEDFEAAAGDSDGEITDTASNTESVLATAAAIEQAEDMAEKDLYAEPESDDDAAEDVAESDEEAAEAAEDVAESDEEAAEAAEDVAESDEEAAEAAEDVAESDEEAAEAAEDVAESDEEAAEAVEDDAESDEEVADAAEDDAEIDIMSTIAVLEAPSAASQNDTEEEPEADDEADNELPDEVEDESESTAGEEEVDEDDYLDYDDSPRPKKFVTGKTAVITMLATCFVTIALIVGAVWMGLTIKRDIGVTVASYSDRFNACDTNDFSLGQLLVTELISMSDEECTLSADNIKALKSGKTVTKFNNMINITANTRFGKIVSMDVTYNPAVNDYEKPSVICMLLFGNAMSGLFDDITTSDSAFISAYTALVQNCVTAPQKGNDIYVYYSKNDISIYIDYSKMAKTGNYSDVMFHIENKDPDYIKVNKLDFSWLPFDFSSKYNKSSDSATSPSDK